MGLCQLQALASSAQMTVHYFTWQTPKSEGVLRGCLDETLLHLPLLILQAGCESPLAWRAQDNWVIWPDLLNPNTPRPHLSTIVTLNCFLNDSRVVASAPRCGNVFQTWLTLCVKSMKCKAYSRHSGQHSFINQHHQTHLTDHSSLVWWEPTPCWRVGRLSTSQQLLHCRVIHQSGSGRQWGPSLGQNVVSIRTRRYLRASLNNNQKLGP